jgi:hypothetical protein
MSKEKAEKVVYIVQKESKAKVRFLIFLVVLIVVMCILGTSMS